jgi:hypothetical protein
VPIELVTDSTGLARHILSEHRELPAVVIAQDKRKPELVIDAEKLASELGQLATVHVITKPLANAFQSEMPENANVYGNAVRVYEPGAFVRGLRSEFTARPSFTPEGMDTVIAGAIRQVMRVAARKAAIQPQLRETPQHSHFQAPARISATICGFIENGVQALATTDDGSLWRIDADAVIPGVRLDWILSARMAVNGLPGPSGQELDIKAMLLRPSIGQLYRHGDTVLGLITGAGPGRIEVTLVPGSVWPVKTAVDNHASIFVVGDVIPVYFTLDRGVGLLRLAPPESAALPAPALIAGGGPWLVQGRTLIQDPFESIDVDAEEEPVSYEFLDRDTAGAAVQMEPRPFRNEYQEQVRGGTVPPENIAGQDTAHKTPLTVLPPVVKNGLSPVPADRRVEKPKDDPAALSIIHRNLVRDRDQAIRDLELVRRRLAATERTLAEMRKKNNDLTKRVRAEQQKIQLSSETEPLFLDEESAVRYEIHSVWATYIPAQEKSRYPEPADYMVGSSLAKTLTTVTNRQRRQKTVETIVDILVKRDERARIMNVHAYRTGNKATKPQLMRNDGAKMFRAYVQTGTPDGLRVHYWVTPEAKIEISSVTVHNVPPS